MPVKTAVIFDQSRVIPISRLQEQGYDTVQFESFNLFEQLGSAYAALKKIVVIEDARYEFEDAIALFRISEPKHIPLIESILRLYGKDNLWIEIYVTPKLKYGHLKQIFNKYSDSNLFVYFPVTFSRNYYSAHTARRFVERLIQKGFKVKVRQDLPTPNLTIENLRHYEGTEQIQYQRAPKKCNFSIVIPVYNNKKFVLHELLSLRDLKYPSENFEVILVDDGSSDGLLEEALALADQLPFYFTLIHNPRQTTRKMGDLNYRAGLSRNIGASYARGENIVFLDSDILVPASFLQTLESELKNHGLIMCRRKHIKPNLSQLLPRHDEVRPTDLMSTDYGYWDRFHEQGDEWDQMPHKWKYVCTHSLCMSTDLFKRSGGIANNYNVYGYEDVQLGFQISKLKIKYKLSDNTVYHLSPKTERSEFAHQHHKKMQLLSQSSQIFYFNTLDKSVLEHTKVFWRPSRWVHRLAELKLQLGHRFNLLR